jgi:hypothetical protein
VFVCVFVCVHMYLNWSLYKFKFCGLWTKKAFTILAFKFGFNWRKIRFILSNDEIY